MTPPNGRVVLPGRFRAAVFDMDGVLLDTEPLWFLVFAETAALHGGTFTPADKAGTMGKTLASSSAYIAALVGGDPGVIAEEIAAAIERRYLAGAPTVRGARELVNSLTGRLPMAVATNTHGEIARRALNVSGLGGFEAVVSGADLGHPKPHPAVYLEACRLLGVAPTDAVAFEDSAVGVESALRAGLTVVAVPQDDLDLTGSGAQILLSSLQDVVLDDA